jgi:hypothetical protein
MLLFPRFFNLILEKASPLIVPAISSDLTLPLNNVMCSIQAAWQGEGVWHLMPPKRGLSRGILTNFVDKRAELKYDFK